MKVKNNKFQKGDVVFYRSPGLYLDNEWVTVKIKTVFPVDDSYRYLVKFFHKCVAEHLGEKSRYVDEVNLSESCE